MRQSSTGSAANPMAMQHEVSGHIGPTAMGSFWESVRQICQHGRQTLNPATWFRHRKHVQ
jgi:hypothetical protein